MGPFKNPRLLALALVSAAVVPGALVVACSSDNANPVPPVYTIEAGPDTGIIQGGDDSSSPGEDAGVDADARAIIPEDAAACTLAHLPAPGSPVSGCWNATDLTHCVPQKDLEFANQCAGTGVTCAPFDNASRLPGYDGGPLPSYN